MIYLKITQAICIYFIMTETNDEQPNALIGRGESVIRPAEPTDVEADDAEQVMKNEETEIEGIKESQGWIFPKVKLSAWDPENEKQWEATGKYIAKRTSSPVSPTSRVALASGSFGLVSRLFLEERMCLYVVWSLLLL